MAIDPVIAFLDKLPVMVDAFDAQGNIVFWNKECERVTGYSAKEIIDHANAFEVLYPDMEYLDHKLGEWDPQKPYRNWEWRVTCKDGTVRDVLWSNFVFDPPVAAAPVWAVGVDITAMKQAERARRESEAKYRAIWEQSLVGIFVVQEDRIVFANQGLADILEVPVTELQTWTMAQANDLVHPEDLARLWRDPAEFPDAEFRLRTPDGKIKWVAQYAKEVQFLGNLANQIMIVDVTDRKTAEEALFEARLREQKLQSIGTLAGGIAHDFNNVLGAILGNVNLIQLNDTLDAETREYLQEMEAAVDQAQYLTHQLLTFAKGGAPVTKVESLDVLLQRSVALVKPGIDCELRVDLPRDLPNVEVDAGQVVQVFNNLLLNAIQASPPGGRVTVTARACPRTGPRPHLPPGLAPGSYTRISVSDEGPGIPAAECPHIFTPYHTTKKDGTGLGLATAYSIVRRHHGVISFESTPGTGTTFHVFLPTTRAPVNVQPVESAPLAEFEGRLLLMDDQKYIRATLKLMLQRLGFTVDAVETGEEALAFYEEKLAQGKSYRLVVLDLTVPGGMGGAETIERLRALDPAVTAIVSSGYSHDQAMSEAAEHGFQGVLKKPFTMEELARLVRDVLE